MKIKKNVYIAFMLVLLMVIPWQAAVAGGKPVKISAPIASETVSGTYTVTGTGKGDPVEVSIDSGSWQAASGGKNWQYSWDTTQTSDGAHTVNARYQGDASEATVSVTVDNGGGVPPPEAGDVVINEYVANSGTEWVELYNTSANELDISNHYIDDIDAGGGAPKQIPASTTIAAGGYYVMTFSSFLNNGGDDVRFLDDSQVALDSTSYTSATADYSWYRSPDGGAWSATETDTPTQGASNGGGVSPPGAGDVVINEYVANSATEWVELYNTTATDLDISNYYLDDIDAGGGAPKQIPADTSIAAGGYYVMTFSSFLNDGGDDVRFLDASQVALDSTSYTSSTAEYSWYRYPDGGTWSGVESATPTQGASNPGTGDTPWQAGDFEIRIFDVGQGDSQLIIFPSGYTILIDVREASWNTGAGAALVAAKIRAITGGSHINVGVLSHLHLDHIGYAGYGGFWGLLETEGITFDKIIDRDAGVWQDGSGGGASDGLCDPDLEIVWHNAGTQSGTSRNWLCYATNSANTKIYPIREIAVLNSTTQIDPPDSGAVVEIIQVDADGVTMVDGTTLLTGDHTGDTTPPSENDYSISLKITYGLLDYATAGDTDGEYATSEFGYTYNNVESVNDSRMGQVDVMQANHHGSSHSTNQDYVNTLNSDVSVISCGTGNSYGHPGQTTLDRLLATSDVYLTNDCNTAVNYGASVIVDGDIILNSSNGTNYTVNGTAYVATDPGPPVTYDVSDILVNEVLPAPTGGNPEWIELYNPTPIDIDISGAYIDDIASGGGSPKVIPASTIISAGGHWTMDTSRFFNNSGDDARLLLSDQTTVVDSYTYSSSQSNKSWYRSPDGGTWAGSMTSSPTKGTSNP